MQVRVVPVLVKNFSQTIVTQMAGPTARAADKTGHESGKRFGGRFSGGIRTGIGPISGMFRGFGPQMAAAFGGAALVAGIKSVTDEAREAAVVGRITEARLRSTGGAANVSAKQVSGLAERLSNLVGVDDEVIQAGENLLLSFKGVRNEAGRGNDIFTQATKLSVDLAAGMNNGTVSAGGLKTANIQLGKALEDPIRGITALRRSGVSFTEQQKAQIKTLVESGDTLGAQKLILKAVGEQFGGTAAASADAGKRFGVFVANIKEKIGTVLLPIMNQLLGFLIERLPGAFAGVGAALRPIILGFQALGAAFSGEGITTSSRKFVGVMERIGVVLRTIVDAALGAFRRNLDLIKRILPAVAVGLAALLVATKVAGAIQLVAVGIRAIGLAVAANPLGLLALAAVAVGAALLVFFRNTETGRRVLQTLWAAAKTLAQVFVTQIVPAVASAVGAFMRGLMPGLKTLGAVLRAQVLPALKVVAIVIGATLYIALTKVLPFILRLAGPVLGFLFKQLGQTIQWISNVVRFIGRLGAWFLRWIAGTRTTGEAVRVLGQRVGAFAASMSKQWQSIVRQVTGALGTMRRVTVTVLAAMIRFWLRWAGNVIDAAASALGWMPGLGPKLRTAQAKFHAFAGSVNAALNKIQDEGVNVKIKGSFMPPKGFSVYDVVGRMHTGGKIPGYGGGDRVPILAEAGETVVSKEHSRLPFMREAFSAAGVPGFRRGGGIDLKVLAPRIDQFRAGIQRTVDAIGARAKSTLERRLRILLTGGVGKANILRFIRSVDPLPYIWGAAGPRGYDCSGLAGAVYGKMRGDRAAGHGKRYFTTASISTRVAGLKQGLGGTLQIGVTSGSGHMAGRYGGLGFEARSSRTGIFTGRAARRPETFARRFHMAKGGPVEGRLLDALARAGVVDVGGDTDRMRINGRVFDQGGLWPPGTIGLNASGRTERVLGPGQEVPSAEDFATAVRRALDGMTVQMDGQTVGALTVGPQLRAYRQLRTIRPRR
jgi:hypothetical protein